MTITALPEAPSRSDAPEVFVAKANVFVAALAQLVTEMNAAIGVANLTKWISGTTYAIGDAVWSPADFQGYRRKTAGAGTTDPSADSTNWQRTEISASSVQTQSATAFTTAGTAPGYTLTPTPALAAYAANQRFRVKFNASGTTGSNTLNISGLGVKNLKQYDATGAKVAAIVAANQLADVEYDGTDMVILTPLLNGSDRLQPISASVASNAMTISASALSLDFRSATLGSGTVTTVSGTPANLVISSGSTLGTISGKRSRIAVLALNNAGTIELAAINVAGGTDLMEAGVISTTAEVGAGAADSASVVYSTTARASVAYRVIGYIESTQATAGTWATAPSMIQGAGGMATLSRGLTPVAAVAATSGTSIDFAAIPAGTKRISVHLNGVSTSGTSNLLLRFGTAGGIQSSTYSGASYGGQNGGSPSILAWSTGVELQHAAIVAAADVLRGAVTFTLLDAANNIWAVAGLVNRSGASASYNTLCGNVELTGEVTTLRLTTSGGSDTFDAGSTSIAYE